MYKSSKNKPISDWNLSAHFALISYHVNKLDTSEPVRYTTLISSLFPELSPVQRSYLLNSYYLNKCGGFRARAKGSYKTANLTVDGYIQPEKVRELIGGNTL